MPAVRRIGVVLAGVAALGVVAWQRLATVGTSASPGAPDPFRPDPISVTGRLIDAKSGAGLKDAFVLINLRGFRAGGLGSEGHSGCMNGSGVVRTDDEGRYHYEVRLSETSAKPYPDEWAAYVAPYMPGRRLVREAPESAGNPPEQVEFSARVRTEFRLIPVDPSLGEKLSRIARLRAVACEAGTIDRGWTEWHRAVLDEIHGSACTSAVQEPIAYSDFMEAMDREHQALMSIADWRANRVHPDSTDSTARWIEYRRSLREAAPAYPWPSLQSTGIETAPERPFTIGERKALCATIDAMRSDLLRQP